MSDRLTGSIPYGPAPWRQTSWDARAAGNFVFGGAGSGLVVFAVVAGTTGVARAALLVAGLALIGLGLFCVSLELGRPLRALNVFINPRTSWMSREAIAAAALMAAGALAAFVEPAAGWIAAALAMAFAYCQANILRAARGIPAWREPLVVALLVSTALAEGAGLFLVAAPWMQPAARWVLATFAALVVVRLLVWLAYRQRLVGRVAPDGQRALERAGVPLLYGGTLAPLALVVLVAAVDVAPAIAASACALAGALAALAGAYLKFTLITRASFNQGFALVHLPVRGVRR